MDIDKKIPTSLKNKPMYGIYPALYQTLNFLIDTLVKFKNILYHIKNKNISIELGEFLG